MNPIANLAEQLELARAIQLRWSDADRDVNLDDGARLAELVLALYEWRQSGGFDPYAGDVAAGPVAVVDTDTAIDSLRAAVEYHPEGDSSMDALIDYKDALEDRYRGALEEVAGLQARGRAWDAIDAALLENARGSMSAADVCAVGFSRQQQLRPPQGVSTDA